MASSSSWWSWISARGAPSRAAATDYLAKAQQTSRQMVSEIAIEDVASVDREQVKLLITRDQAGTGQLRDWVDEHVTSRLPGGTR